MLESIYIPSVSAVGVGHGCIVSINLGQSSFAYPANGVGYNGGYF